ncbi:MAG TPA: 4-alpha-glucanotransferase [Actinomycetota bacterium]|nr:4-alpha-glucanotransferase [Actinomycetota bacterium]
MAERYEDHGGVIRQAPEETIARILEAMDATTARPPEASVHVTLQSDEIKSPTAVAIELEDGSSERVTDGRLAPGVPLGYHRLVHANGTTSRLIVSPGRCFLPEDLEVWGWAVQLYATRSRESWGIGDLHDLQRLAHWARASGAGALLLNPMDAVSPGIPQQTSPYFPSSRCFLDPLYLRVEDLPGAAEASEEISSAATSGRGLNSDRLIDRDRVYAAKMEALGSLWSRFSGDRRFDMYRAERGQLLSDFATFTALSESYGGDPSEWPTGLQRRDHGELELWRGENESRVLFHEWLQWLLDEQMKAAHLEIDLIQDLPVGVDPTGADAWIWQDGFAEGTGVGAPPDDLNTAGQRWGLVPFDPWKLRAAEYEPFIQTVRAALRHASGLRLDHVMGLFRLFWIPAGMPPSAGTYVQYPAHDLLNILALESHRADAYMIGEDLGTVEPVVRREMAARAMLSYRVLWFEETEPAEYPRLALATVTNHDLPTIAGVWTGADLEEQQRVLAAPNRAGAAAMRAKLQKLARAEDIDVETIIEAAYRSLAQAPCRVVIATLEDALGVERRPNIPGTTFERPNWSMSLPRTIEELEEDRLAGAIVRTLSRRRSGTGRRGSRG